MATKRKRLEPSEVLPKLLQLATEAGLAAEIRDGRLVVDHRLEDGERRAVWVTDSTPNDRTSPNVITFASACELEGMGEEGPSDEMARMLLIEAGDWTDIRICWREDPGRVFAEQDCTLAALTRERFRQGVDDVEVLAKSLENPGGGE